MDKQRAVEAGKQGDPLFAIDGRNGVWSIPAWCAQFGCSEPYYYALNPRPREVRLGRKVRLTESPAGYLERVRKLQDRAAKRIAA
ncbi:MAG: hypothetical protein IT530_02285 [Burkholderiales bacterium]|nr:hypothetical protein [Burkholderiales bacterium]